MTLALFLDLLTRDPVQYISWVVAVVISITLHELGHGVAAVWQGDETPKLLGHMTLDPRAHMPGMSWVLLLLVGISYGLMPVNPARFRSRYGAAMVAAAGPAVNLILAVIGFGIWLTWLKLGGEAELGTRAGNFQEFFRLLGNLNIVLCIFNLMPLPPLDGSAIVGNFSPAFARAARDPRKQQLFFGVFIMIFLFAGFVFWGTADAIQNALYEFVMGSNGPTPG
jgi:Zn-dependent protease